jgi:hypothetical protein
MESNRVRIAGIALKRCVDSLGNCSESHRFENRSAKAPIIKLPISMVGAISCPHTASDFLRWFCNLEPIRKLVESDESDMIPCQALDSVESARCGNLSTAVPRIELGFVTRVI